MSEPARPTLREYVVQWLTKANNDLLLAQHERALKRGPMVTDGICYHCQQSVEKDLKAFLVWNSVDFQKVHDVQYLRRLCVGLDAEFGNLDLGVLSSYGVRIRYPDDFRMPGLGEVDAALRQAAAVKSFVLAKLGVSPSELTFTIEQDEGSPAVG